MDKLIYLLGNFLCSNSSISTAIISASLANLFISLPVIIVVKRLPRMRIKSAFCIAKFAALLAAIAPTHPITSSLLVSRMSTDDVEYTAGIFVFEINVLSSFCACAERIPLPKRMIGRLALLIFQ